MWNTQAIKWEYKEEGVPKDGEGPKGLIVISESDGPINALKILLLLQENFIWKYFFLEPTSYGLEISTREKTQQRYPINRQTDLQVHSLLADFCSWNAIKIWQPSPNNRIQGNNYKGLCMITVLHNILWNEREAWICRKIPVEKSDICMCVCTYIHTHLSKRRSYKCAHILNRNHFLIELPNYSTFSYSISFSLSLREQALDKYFQKVKEISISSISSKCNDRDSSSERKIVQMLRDTEEGKVLLVLI